jgi:hypothetical protein
MERVKCIICNTTLDTLYILQNMPISLSVTTTSNEQDKVQELHLANCTTCGCVQLKKLTDPNILYETSHNLTFHLPLWQQHHNEFLDFILKSCPYTKILEIGGSSGALYSKLQEKTKNIEYSCIDICKPSFDTSNINYIVDNCETYDFTGNKCILMSHVFEHLYTPTTLIQNLAKTGVETVYISIPNMYSLLKNQSPSILHFEHTYYVDKYFCEYLFSQEGYSLDAFYQFKQHSIFMKFIKTNCTKIPIQMRKYIPEEISKIYKSIQSRFTKFTIPENSFIMPAGHLGQLFYTINCPTKIMGFLDNDTSKQGKRQYGTPYMIYPTEKLKNFNDRIFVYLYGGPYTSEIVEQLKQYSNVEIIIV